MPTPRQLRDEPHILRWCDECGQKMFHRLNKDMVWECWMSEEHEDLSGPDCSMATRSKTNRRRK
jgi:hypothetical protein